MVPAWSMQHGQLDWEHFRLYSVRRALISGCYNRNQRVELSQKYLLSFLPMSKNAKISPTKQEKMVATGLRICKRKFFRIKIPNWRNQILHFLPRFSIFSSITILILDRAYHRLKSGEHRITGFYYWKWRQVYYCIYFIIYFSLYNECAALYK